MGPTELPLAKGTIAGVFFNLELAVELLCWNLWASEQQRLTSLLHLSSTVGFYPPLSLPVTFSKLNLSGEFQEKQ